jgi:hypothetical protein
VLSLSKHTLSKPGATLRNLSRLPRVQQPEETIMPDQPNKPAGAFEDDGGARPVEDQQAVKNQSTVKPEDYPEPAGSELAPPNK